MRLHSWGFALLVGLAFFLSSLVAAAGDKDDAATIAAIDKVLSVDVAESNFGDAKKKLKSLLDKCQAARTKCSPGVVARVYVAQGVVYATINQNDDATKAWNSALDIDPSAALPTAAVTPAIKTAWETTQKAWVAKNPQMDDAQKAGWASKQAFENAKAAIQAESAENWPECIDKDKAALTVEENLRARLHLAMCEAKANKVIDALRDNQKALETAKTKNDASAIKLIQDRVTELLPRLAHLKFDAPVSVSDLKINFDDRAIPPARAAENFTIDPGKHTVHAEGTLRGARVSFDQELNVKDGDTVVVKITLKPAALTQAQLECLVGAKTQEEALACVGPEQKSTIVAHGRLDISGYNDSYSVEVLTPSVSASVSSPTAGWNVGASYLIDFVTAASPDVTSTASPHFKDTRNAVTVTGGYKPDRWGAQLFGDYSTEADYISRTVGLALIGDFYDKQVTPSISYAHSQDTIGRADTDFNVYSKDFATESITAGSTFVLTRVSVLQAGVSVGIEHGDQSKPYRYIPMFAPGVNPSVGASYDVVNGQRLPIKPLEQLPLERQRYALTGRYIWRSSPTATMRIEERLYDDSWAVRASTTDFRYYKDLGARLRVWPHGHLHVQTGAAFYQRVYGATVQPDGSTILPQFRTSDRELSPFIGATGGGGIRYSLTDPTGGSKFQVGVIATADVLFDYYFNTFYVRSRLGEYGTLGVEADFE